MIVIIIALAAFAYWAQFIVKWAYKLLNVKLISMKERDPNIEERFKPYERCDMANWNHVEIYLCAVFLLPIRGFIIFASLVSLFVFISIIQGFKSFDTNYEHPAWRRFLIKASSRLCSRTILYCSGFYWIKLRTAKISDFDSDHAKAHGKNPTQIVAPIIISNHTSWLDIIYHTSTSSQPSFLSKVEVSKYPIIGMLATSFQSIFVDRSSRFDKDQVNTALITRGKLLQEGKNFPPIVIYPEGTTSNGRYLVSFKKGAFEPNLPIKIVCIEYPTQHFDIALDFMGQAANFFLVLCQLKNNISVQEFDVFYPSHLKATPATDKEEQWEVYAKAVKSIMLKAMPHMKNSESGFREVKDYQAVILEKEKEFKDHISKQRVRNTKQE